MKLWTPLLLVTLCFSAVVSHAEPVLLAQAPPSQDRLVPLRLPSGIAGLKAGWSTRRDVNRVIGEGQYVEGGHGGRTYHVDRKRTVCLTVTYGVDRIAEEIRFERMANNAARHPASAVSATLSESVVLDRGIGLGGTVDVVLKRYGKPTKDRLIKGLRILEWETDYMTTRDVLFYALRCEFRGGRLVAFSISNGE